VRQGGDIDIYIYIGVPKVVSFSLYRWAKGESTISSHRNFYNFYIGEVSKVSVSCFLFGEGGIKMAHCHKRKKYLGGTPF